MNQQPRLLFVLGSPRSGTSWAANLLSDAEHVATSPELHYFSNYAVTITRTWDGQTQEIQRNLAPLDTGGSVLDRVTQLPSALEPDELHRWLRYPVELLIDKARSADPELVLFVSKTPSDSCFVPLIAELFPEAQFLHVVRNPLAVIASLRAASRSWGKHWAPRSVILGALLWRTHVVGAADALRLDPASVGIARYEDIRTDPEGFVRTSLERLGLPVEAGDPARGEEVHGGILLSDLVSRARRGDGIAEPEGFGDGMSARKGVGGFRTWIVEVLCGDLMTEYGYEIAHPSSQRLAGVTRWMLGLAERAYNRHYGRRARSGLRPRPVPIHLH